MTTVLTIVPSFLVLNYVLVRVLLNIPQVLRDLWNHWWFSILHFLRLQSHAVIEIILVQRHLIAKMFHLSDTLFRFYFVNNHLTIIFILMLTFVIFWLKSYSSLGVRNQNFRFFRSNRIVLREDVSILLLVLHIGSLKRVPIVTHIDFRQLTNSFIWFVSIQLLERLIVGFSLSVKLLSLLQFKKIKFHSFRLMRRFIVRSVVVVIVQLIRVLFISWVNGYLLPKFLVFSSVVIKILQFIMTLLIP